MNRSPLGQGFQRRGAELRDETDLVQGMLRGEQRAFDEFFDAYAARLGAFAARRSSLDAAALEDVVQITMISAIRGLASFRGGSTLFTWLCQICRNHLADARRKSARQPMTKSLDEVTGKKPAEIVELIDYRDPLDECTEDSTRSGVRQTINLLPASYAHILELRYGDDLTVPEIARLLQLSESAAESRLVRARQAFRDKWVGAGGEADAAPAAQPKERI
jgi:RNA polymerase sigma-70 factor (ECF subfamily)